MSNFTMMDFKTIVSRWLVMECGGRVNIDNRLDLYQSLIIQCMDAGADIETLTNDRYSTHMADVSTPKKWEKSKLKVWREICEKEFKDALVNIASTIESEQNDDIPKEDNVIQFKEVKLEVKKEIKKKVEIVEPSNFDFFMGLETKIND